MWAKNCCLCGWCPKVWEAVPSAQKAEMLLMERERSRLGEEDVVGRRREEERGRDNREDSMAGPHGEDDINKVLIH